jgi:diguanylate cyclase (GGDEF)-like protein
VHNKWLILWVLCLLAATAGLLVWYHYGMNRTLRLDSAGDYELFAYDDSAQGGHSAAHIRQSGDTVVLSCHLSHKYAWPYCGFSATLTSGTHGYDLSWFDTVAFDIRTSGPRALPVKIYLRNFNPAYSKKGDTNSLKVNSLQYIPAHGDHPFVVPLKNFQVASWWIQQYHIAPEQASPDLSNISVLDISTGDQVETGDYKISVRSITFYGKWLGRSQLLSIILALWLASALIYLLGSFWEARRAMSLMRMQKKELEEINGVLELERKELQQLATHDELTGLYNRVGLRNRLYTLVSRARQDKQDLSIIFMDIDYFKKINDQHGHATGDDVLRRFANFVVHHTRDQDYFCRWGGEEFILLCGDTPLDAATTIAEKLRALISEQEWPKGIILTCSFGVAQMAQGEGTALFLKRADEALYSAKRAGRNRVGGSIDADTPIRRSA